MELLTLEQIFNKLKMSLLENVDDYLMVQKISIECKQLTPQEAIGSPFEQDYPIIKGKEKMIEASFMSAKGQAFTDEYGNSIHTLKELIDIPLTSNKNRAKFIAGFNAVFRAFDLCDKTIHCRDLEPSKCGEELLKVINPNEKILLIGLQPRLLQSLAQRQSVRVIDLEEDNVGQVKFGVTIDADNKTDEAIRWCDRMLVTGSTIVNGTIVNFINQKKPVIFFGVTISAAAKVLGLPTFCAFGH